MDFNHSKEGEPSMRLRRHLTLVALTAVAVGAAVVGWHNISPGANQDDTEPSATPRPEKPPAPGSALPVTQVVLFNSGVGYYQREGDVSGDASVQLSFPTGEVNDLLRSLVLQDQDRGRVGVITYDSHDPVDKTLRSFALNLTNNPTLGQILNQARGEKVEVLHRPRKDAAAEKLSGVIVGMQAQTQQLDRGGTQEVELLNLLGGTGLQSIPLEQVQAVRFLNKELQAEFERALQVLATAHDTQKKTVNLQFLGDGKRRVKVGYVVERPIWKTSYRLLIGDNGKLFVQGWALVENTSDDDWNGVRVVLVSGRPISYQMNLYEPLYIPRPWVEPELFASLRPPVYSGAMDAPIYSKAGLLTPLNAPQQVPPQAMLRQVQPQQAVPYYINGSVNTTATTGIPTSPGSTPTQQQNRFQSGQFSPAGVSLEKPLSAGGIAAMPTDTQNGEKLFNFYQGLTRGQPDNQKLTYAELQQRREAKMQQLDQARKAGAAIGGMNFREGITSVATAEELGDYYQYVIDQKVTLPRQKSAMLPILNQAIDGSKVSIYNAAVHEKYPLLGLRLKNTSGQPLTQGPITVYEGGAYAGDTRILDLQPNEERLLSYALDQTTEVKAESKTSPSPDMTLKIGGDNLTANYRLRQTTTYTLKNRAAHERTVILEHPIRGHWKLVAPAKATEKSRDVYRFQVTAPAGKTVTFDVAEDQARLDQLALTGGGDRAPFYAVAAGVEVKPLVKTSEPELTSLKIVKGVVLPVHRSRESKTYFVQNNSAEDRTFTVDHVVRDEYKRLAKDGDQVGPAVYRFKLTVAAKKTGLQEVLEERTHRSPGHGLHNVPDEEMRRFVASAAVGAKVKAALKQFMEMRAEAAETGRQLVEQKGQLKVLTEDQARLRENLKIVPQTSEPYKNFLQKFVAQEAEIDGHQKQIRQLEVALSKQQRGLESFVSALTVE
jgi:hypothetical protein